MSEEKKGLYVAEPGIAVSEFVQKINKLSFQNFPSDDVMNLLKKDSLAFEFWDPYLFFSDVRYTRNLIHKTPEFELILKCWKPGQKSPIAGLKGSGTWFRIEKGALQITHYQEDPAAEAGLLKKIDATYLKQEAVEFPAGIYQLENVSSNDAVSLHICVPPCAACDIYDLDANEKRNVSINYHSIHGKLVAPEDKR